MLRIGIDLGGSKVEGIALRDNVEVGRVRLPTPRDDYDATVGVVAAIVAELEAHARATASVGVGIPGAIAPGTGLVKNANSTWLIGRPLQADLEARLNRPVRVANDANCFAISEAVDGAAAGADVVFGVILGTGVGGGVVVGGHVLTGPNAIAGEWGHNPLPWPSDDENPGPPCYCGHAGCIEAFLSGPALAADYARGPFQRVPDIGDGGDSSQFPASWSSPVLPSATDVVAMAAAGDPNAESALSRYEHRLARALASVINILDPDVIVLGGGLSNIERLYSNVPPLFPEFVFGAQAAAVRIVRTRLVRALHGDSSGVRGAAWLWVG
jgi:fructokinase